MSDDSQQRIKPKSVAAFLFMPQFSLCFQQFSFIMPVFIRTIAAMFVGAGLLPQGHPATLYGMKGVKKYGFFELMGEAWHRLRATSATPYQWSLFASVVLMVFFVIVSVVAYLLHIFGMFAGTAAAQIFDSPISGSPTDTASVPHAANVGDSFDQTVPAAGTGHGDYAIMVLDKLLRQGAEGVGGSMQNAVRGLMSIYTTGVLVIAGIMLFWIIISVVVDTAKTGQIGGGRHNMVWAPIRIVFALGLLIPLGSTGFSSGQFMVMKLAEWGSNFGSHAWKAYVDSIANNGGLVATRHTPNTTDLVNQYVRMWLCRVSYNGYVNQATTPDPKQIVKQNPINSPDKSKNSYSFGNDADSNLCGMVTYPTQTDPATLQALGSGDGLAVAKAKYEQAVKLVWSDLFTDMNNNFNQTAKDLACGFASQHLFKDATHPYPLLSECGSTGGGNLCGAGPADGSGPKYPTEPGCLEELVKVSYATVDQAVNGSGGAHATLDAFAFSSIGLSDITSRGWAGMGTWSFMLARINSTVFEASEIPVSVSGGNLATVASIPLGLGGDAVKVQEILGKYDSWWQTAPSAATGGYTGTGSTKGLQGDVVKPPKDKEGAKALASAFADGGTGAANALASYIPIDSPFVTITSPENDHLTPISKLSALGDMILITAILIYVTISAIAIGVSFAGLACVLGSGLCALSGVGTTIATSPLFALFNSLAASLFGAGVLLAFWIPILPFIRVAFGVLTWMIAVFEAVMLVPIAALAHLTTEGEGIAGGGKQAWIIWLNVLLRPVLMVIGYVGALLVLETFFTFFTPAYITAVESGVGTFTAFFGLIFYIVLYAGVIYTVANSCFKLIDLLPSAVSKYLGGQPDTSFDQDVSGFVSATGAAGVAAGQAVGKAVMAKSQPKKEPGTSGGGPHDGAGPGRGGA